MSPPQPPRLLDQVREAIRRKHFSLKPEKSCVYYIRDFILFQNKRYPREMGADEIRAYLSHLMIQRHVSPSTQKDLDCDYGQIAVRDGKGKKDRYPAHFPLTGC